MRIGIGIGIGFPRASAGEVAPPATTPLTLLEAIRAGSGLQWQRPDADKVTLNGSGVATLADQSANLYHDTQATPGAQPLWIASVAAANNRPAIQFDNVDDYLENTIAHPAPLTTSTFIWLVLRQDAWTLSDNLFCGVAAASSICVAQQATSPNLRMLNSTAANENSGMGLLVSGLVKRAAFYFSGSVNDFSRVGSVLATGASSGNGTGSTAQRKGTNRTLSTFTGWTMFDWVVARGLTPAEAATAVTSLDAYATPLFGAGIIT